ncbi:MAG TPA: type II toxin-antitoxin system HicB family antitoxin [Ktedonobacterales bacterium]
MNTQYEVVIDWDERGGYFVARVPELNGCMADGPTRAEALANVQEAIELWLDVAREEGWPIPKPHTLAAAR